MRELTRPLSALGFALTSHPDEGRPHAVLDEHDGSVMEGFVQTLIDTQRIAPPPELDAKPRWVSIEDGGRVHRVVDIPIWRSVDGSIVMLSAFYDVLPSEAATTVEDALGQLRPFAAQYVRMWQIETALARQVAALEAALNLIDIGVIVLERTGAIAFCNDAAAAILSAGDGLRKRGGSIAASQLDDDLKLQVAIDHVMASQDPAAESDPGVLMLPLKREQATPLIVSVVPAPRTAQEPAEATAIVYLTDRGVDLTPLLQPVCKLFALTPVETRLACFIASGTTLADAARAMRVKDTTARTTLAEVFFKTKTNRQAELVHLLMSSMSRISRVLTINVV